MQARYHRPALASVILILVLTSALLGVPHDTKDVGEPPEPPANARLIFVSPNGSDTQFGLDPEHAVQSLERAFSLLRDNSSDWLLLERGHNYSFSQLIDRPTGTRDTALVITCWGEGPSPKIAVGPNAAAFTPEALQRHYVALHEVIITSSPPPSLVTNIQGQFPGLDIPVIHFVYAQEIWQEGEDLSSQPNEEYFKTAIRRTPRDTRICLDVEHLPSDQRLHPETEVLDTLEILIQLIDWAHEARPGCDVGFYGLPPIRDYWSPVAGNDDVVTEWENANQGLTRLAEKCDTIYPSLYTFYEDRNAWVRYARSNIRQALAYGKPVIPVLWPRYHVSNPERAMQGIEADFWRLQLDTIHEAGLEIAIIWDAASFFQERGHPAWDETTPWIAATQVWLDLSD